MPLKIGHRGAPKAAPENTLSAFRLAIAQGADGVELDVHRCRSGEVVVIHDDTVDRTTDGGGAVAQMTWEQLSRLRIAGNERIPMLEETLAALEGKYVFIEIKHPDSALPAARLVQQRMERGAEAGKLWLISFNHAALEAIHREYPSLLTGASFEALDSASARAARAVGARAIIPHHRALNVDRMQEAQALGLKVFCWTVNEPADIARMRALEVDGIISDYPERL